MRDSNVYRANEETLSRDCLNARGNGDANNDIAENHHVQTELTCGTLLDTLLAVEK